jgi:predicted AAA+ superfamily ATPase
MEEKSKNNKVIVVGDVWVNNVLIPISREAPGDRENARLNHRNEISLDVVTLPGGALLIKDMMNSLLDKTGNIEIVSYPEKDLERLSNREIICTLAEGALVSNKKADGEIYYIKKFLGYSGYGPDDGIPSFARDFTFEPSVGKDVIIIKDSNKGFRNVENSWKHILKNSEKYKNSIVIYNMSSPLFTGKLWKALSQKNLLNRVILIIDANDLREEGVNISRKLSWDRTIADFVTILAYGKHDDMEKCPHILVRFGLEGVIYYHLNSEKGKERERDVQVFYIPNKCEDEIIEDTPGEMKGLTSAFTGFFALHMIEPGKSTEGISGAIIDAVPPAADRVIQLLEKGYKKDNNRFQYPFKEVLSESSPGLIKKIDLHHFNLGYFESIRKSWNILSHQIPLDYHLKDIAREYVIHGKAGALDNVPIARFGKLLTVDKNEIENFRSIQSLIKEYLKDKAANKPLSIAVFGPPGSGKSFAVKSVAKSVMGKKTEILEYNISQFESPADIIRAFHEVIDYSLKGTTPLVFFDEFDSSYNNESLGWLKYFLAPMQDGEFKEGEKTHPIGRVILVFAGGTNRSLQEFTSEREPKKLEKGKDFRGFIAAKGPDFVSRLKGYVNILGPNPINRDDGQDTAPCRDRFFVIRRAVLLRALLLQQKNIVTEDGKIRIDEDVLRSLLVIPKYKHGARSMAAIINMSMLNKRERYEKAALPSPKQLSLHLDSDVFMNILDRDLIVKIASIDRAIHEVYFSTQREMPNAKSGTNSSIVDWENLDKETKQLNRMLAESIPFYLLLINCSYRPKSGESKGGNQFKQFTGEEIDYIARMVHERWVYEKSLKEWTYGEQRNDGEKVHDYIMSWEQLPEDKKRIDQGTVKAIPQILGNVGFEVYRLEEKNKPLDE